MGTGIAGALCICSVAAIGCGGRIALPDGSRSPTAPWPDGQAQEPDGEPRDEDAAFPDASLEASTERESSDVADSPPPSDTMATNPAFLAACSPFASAYGRASCELCFESAMRSCGMLFTQIEAECEAQYRCVSVGCLCTRPCDTTNLCSCATGCLPSSGTCVELWTQLMTCMSSSCSGKC
jgi:hypothetical protein